MMNAQSKLRIVNKARRLKLWPVSCDFKEEMRSVLRTFGMTRQDAVSAAWRRLEIVLDRMSLLKIKSFERVLAGLTWQSLLETRVTESTRFDSETGWAFRFFLDENATAPTPFAKSVADFGRTDPDWFLVAGCQYFWAKVENNSQADSKRSSVSQPQSELASSQQEPASQTDAV